MDILAVGHSHIRAIKDACRLENIEGMDDHQFDTMLLTYKFWKSLFQEDSGHNGSGVDSENAATHSEMLAGLAGKDAIVFSLFGNRHNTIGLLNLPEPFDFVFDEDDEVSHSEKLVYVPRKIVKHRMEAETRPIFDGLKKMAEFVPDDRTQLFCLESPPPIPSEAHIRAHPLGFDPELIEAHGIAPIGLRKKMWKLHSELVAQYCAELGIVYVPVPDTAQDENGCLIEAAWFNDPSHANAFYGKLVLEDLFENVLKDSAI